MKTQSPSRPRSDTRSSRANSEWKAGEAPSERDELFRAIFRQGSIGIAVLDTEQHFLRVNPSFSRFLGYEEGELVGRALEEVTALADVGRSQSQARSLLAGELASLEMDKQYRRKDGELVWGRVSAALFRGQDGSPIGTVAMVQDITDRKAAEEALKASQIQLAEAMDLADLANWEFDLDTGLFTFNDRFYALYGTSAAIEGGYQMPAEVYSRKFVHPEEQHMVAEEVNKAIQSTDPSYRADVEHRIVRRDGTIGHIVVRLGITKDEHGRTIKTHGANQDITKRTREKMEKEELQIQLLQAQRMESVGRLAGGIAHDFNNLLFAIIGNSSLALAAMRPEDPNRELIAEVYKVAERAAGLTRQILAFSRRQILKPQVLNLNEIVIDMEPLLRRTLGEDVALHLILEPDLQQTEVDRPQTEQVLMNLVINARDAMSQGGSLTIETADVTLDRTYSQINPEVKPGRYVMLAVSDNGCGMDEETRSRVFEPFFTTKDVGKGTGLGLSTVFGIVKQSGGSVSTYSELGQGSTFKIYLPAIHAEVATVGDSPAEEGPTQGAETILVVEDEDSVRRLVTRILSRAGYQIVGAGSAPELDKVLANNMPAPDLLLTDVVLPGGASGRDVAEMLLARYPDLRVIFMSGYTMASVVHDGRLDEGIEFLEKPFTPDVLLRKVRAVLDAEPGEIVKLAASRTR